GRTRLVLKDAGYATAVAFTPDGNYLALANNGRHSLIRTVNNQDQVIFHEDARDAVRLVTVGDGKVLHAFRGHVGGIDCLSFSPDGRTLASGGADTTVLVWDVAAGLARARKEGPPLDRDQLNKTWLDLRENAETAHRAMARLIAIPSQG